MVDDGALCSQLATHNHGALIHLACRPSPGIAFSGWTDPAKAVADSAKVVASLPGTKWISLGGGNANGAFPSVASVSAITSAINAGTFAGYSGIVFDIEEGTSGLASAFAQSFAAAKSKGFKVSSTHGGGERTLLAGAGFTGRAADGPRTGCARLAHRTKPPTTHARAPTLYLISTGDGDNQPRRALRHPRRRGADACILHRPQH